jgi:hypothetical protein
MCSIEEIREALAVVAADFDASTKTIERCKEIVAAATAIERMAAAIKTVAAARVAQSGSWRASGDRSPAHELARETGTTIGAARETLETGDRLTKLPALSAAARRGELSPTQTAAVAAVGAVAPTLVPTLIERAKDTTVSQLREECARAIATRQDDPEAARKRIREQRSLRHWVDAAGGGVLQLRDSVDVIAGVMTDLAPIREAMFQESRQRGEHLRPDAADADALVAAVGAARHGNVPQTASDKDGAPARLPHRCAPRSKILVRVDFDALLRGRPIDGEVCEIAGYGPVAVSAVRELLGSGDAFLAGIVTKGTQVVGVAHLGRRATALQATALEWTNPTCAADGCTRAVRLEIDHRKSWASTKVTITDLLDRLCEHDHDLKTRFDWSLVDGTGKRPFVPPTDPRHPNHIEEKARGDPPAA